jgi:hypothetical protein
MKHETLASKAADAVGVTPHSDMRLFVEQAVKWALKEAALSAAEPVSSGNDEAGYVEFLNEDVPYIVRDIQGAVAILMDLETRNVIGYRVYDPDSVFAPPAPSVAVRALKPFATDADIYDGQDIDDGEKSFNDNITVGDLRRARAAYAALSAQVQDVAGWQPIETAPKDGTVIQAWHTVHKCPISILWNKDGHDFNGEALHWFERSYTTAWPEHAFSHWMPLPAAPAKQEGGE